MANEDEWQREREGSSDAGGRQVNQNFTFLTLNKLKLCNL